MCNSGSDSAAPIVAVEVQVMTGQRVHDRTKSTYQEDRTGKGRETSIPLYFSSPIPCSAPNESGALYPMENGRGTLTKRLMRRASYPKVEGLPVSFPAITELVEKREKKTKSAQLAET